LQFGARQKGALDNQFRGGVKTSELIVTADPWSPIQLYSFYRLILAGIFLLFSLTNASLVNIGASQGEVFAYYDYFMGRW